MPDGIALCIPHQDENLYGYLPSRVFSLLESECFWTDYLRREKYANNPKHLGMVWALSPVTAEQDMSFYPVDKAIIAANEPEVETQSNTPYAVAVDGLKILQEKFPYTIAPNCNIVFQAGKDYMTNFAQDAEKKNCLPLAWGLHFHGLRTGAELEQHYKGWRDTWYAQHGDNRPIVVTEASPNHLATFEEKAGFLRTAKRLVDRDDKLLSFFWFASRYRAPGLGYNDRFEWAWVLETDDRLSDIGYTFKQTLEGIVGFFPVAGGNVSE